MIYARRPTGVRNVERSFENPEMSMLPIMHIGVDKRGAAVIVGTGVKVKQLVSFRRAWGWTPEQIQENFPQLTLGQIYAAFAYYHDHRAVLDAELDADNQEAGQLAAQYSPDPALIKRLRDASKRT